MNECIEWEGTRFANGYGRVGNRKAHRVAWEKANGPIPAGMLVLHHCDNPPCVNPAHLYLGTHKDNARDRKARDRGVKGRRVNTAKLTEEQVHEVRARCDQGDLHRDVATDLGITQPMVGYIARRQSWDWLPNRTQPPTETELAAQRNASRSAAMKRSWAERKT